MTKIIINVCPGGFKLSALAISKYCEGKNLSEDELLDLSLGNFYRTDPLWVSIVEELGDVATVKGDGKLTVVEVPDNAKWTIMQNDGKESVAFSNWN